MLYFNNYFYHNDSFVRKGCPNLLQFIDCLPFEYVKQFWYAIYKEDYMEHSIQVHEREYLYILKYCGKDTVFTQDYFVNRYSQLIRQCESEECDSKYFLLKDLKVEEIASYEDVTSLCFNEALKCPLTISYSKILCVHFQRLPFRTALDVVFLHKHRKDLSILFNEWKQSVGEKDFFYEQAYIDQTFLFDANSPTHLSVIFQNYRDPTTFYLIPIDVNTYKYICAARLSNLNSETLNRTIQMLLREMLFNDSSQLLHRILESQDSIDHHYNHSNEVVTNHFEYDYYVINHQLYISTDISDPMCETNYLLRKEERNTSYQALLWNVLRERLNKNLVTIKGDIYFNVLLTRQANVDMFVRKYGMESIIQLQWHKGRVYLSNKSGKNDVIALGNTGYALYSLYFKRDLVVVNMVKLDTIYLTYINCSKQLDVHSYKMEEMDMSTILSADSVSDDYEDDSSTAEELERDYAFCKLIMRHLHSDDTVINLDVFINQFDLGNDNLPKSRVIID